MSQHIIVLGDKTSHNGTVISASPFSDSHGKPIARMGDQVSCPKCNGVFPISEGDASFIDDGKPVAYHGCKVSCGAVLIAAQMFTSTEPSAGAGPGASSSAAEALAAQGLGAIGAGLIAGYEEEPLDDEKQRFKGRFRVLDLATGQAVTEQAVRVRSTGGQYLTGSTDTEGCTQWVERDATEALAFDLIEQGQA